jgi:hypothetical protein
VRRSACIALPSPTSGYARFACPAGSTASCTVIDTESNVKECQPRPATPGSFEFRELVTSSLGIPTPVRTLVGDVTGNGSNDIILNHLGATNQVRVATADGNGGFTISAPVTHPETPPEGRANYNAVVGDFNTDGRTDLAWTNLSSANNKTYLGMSNGDGTFEFPSVRATGTTGWESMRTLVADLNGDGCDDFLWNALGSLNYMRSGISDCVNTFTVGPHVQPSNTGSTSFTASIGDVNADLRQDVIWRSDSRTYFGLAAANGNIVASGTMSSSSHPSLGSTGRYVQLLGDVNGDGRTDMIWADTTQNSQNQIGVSTSTGTSLSHRAVQMANYNSTVPLRAATGDVNADGRTDLIFNTTGAANRAFVALGTASGDFDLSPLPQLHPAEAVDWEQFSMLSADVSGDGRADIVWIHPAATLRIYVGVARAP